VTFLCRFCAVGVVLRSSKPKCVDTGGCLWDIAPSGAFETTVSTSSDPIVALNWPVLPITSVPWAAVLRRREKAFGGCGSATMEVLKRSSREYAVVAGADSGYRIGPPQVVDTLRHRVAFAIAMSAVSRYCKESVVNIGIAHPLTFASVLILAPILPITRDWRSMPTRPATRH
jgi:hypothetical protein